MNVSSHSHCMALHGIIFNYIPFLLSVLFYLRLLPSSSPFFVFLVRATTLSPQERTLSPALHFFLTQFDTFVMSCRCSPPPNSCVFAPLHTEAHPRKLTPTSRTIGGRTFLVVLSTQNNFTSIEKNVKQQGRLRQQRVAVQKKKDFIRFLLFPPRLVSLVS